MAATREAFFCIRRSAGGFFCVFGPAGHVGGLFRGDRILRIGTNDATGGSGPALLVGPPVGIHRHAMAAPEIRA
jgi:hypothetical protein